MTEGLQTRAAGCAAWPPGSARPTCGACQAGWALSSVGNWGFMVMLSIYAFEKGGAAAVGLAAGCG